MNSLIKKSIVAGLYAGLPICLAAEEKPNMVIYIADDHGCMQSEPYGDGFVRTPNMQSLANEGMVFNRAFVASPASGPSRGALLSGMMPARNGADFNHVAPRPETQTMVRQLQEQGYEVIAFGKVAHGEKQAQMCGFDYCATRNVAKEALPGALKAYLDKRTSDKPLCIMIGDNRPHVSWTPDMIYDPQDVNLPDYLIDTRETREHYARYLSDVTGLDKTIGEVDRVAEEYFGNRDYLFLYTADHGAQWPFGKWNLYDKGIRTSMLVRWPGNVPAGTRTDAMVSWVDLMPTLIDIAGGEAKGDLDGSSFADVLEDPSKSHRDAVFTTHTSDGNMNLYPMRSVRTESFKYIRNLWPDCYHSNHSDIHRKDGAGAYWDSWEEAAKKDPAAAEIIKKYYSRAPEELYDLKNDPDEKVNLAADPKYRKVLAKMSKMLDSWMEGQGDSDPRLPKNKYLLSGPTPYVFNQRKMNFESASEQGNGSKWKVKETPIITRWGKAVTPENAWREYPRPTMVRSKWKSLNGLWDLEFAPVSQTGIPEKWNNKILVPYPVQTALSGVARQPEADQAVWYKTAFDVPATWSGDRVILNFEAVDFESVIWINGTKAGRHLGSYENFSFDITEYLSAKGTNELVVKVIDETEITSRSVGKQIKKDINNYEDLTGIWQSVWIEPVNATASISDISISTTLSEISIDAVIAGKPNGVRLDYIVRDGEKTVASASAAPGEKVTLEISDPKLWSPETPFLYDIEVVLKKGNAVLDKIESYCGMRTIELSKGPQFNTIRLNGKEIFQVGPLDQNYWPESGLTPPSEKAMLWEIDYMRSIGCNMVRLHIKRNPRLYYTYCDRQGLLVWQDFVCGRDTDPSKEHSGFWVKEQETMMKQLHNHPSIIMWVVFNEAWGQHDPENIFSHVESLDPTRIFSIASGWNDVTGMGSIRDLHDYTFVPSVPVKESRAIVLGECGGFASAVPPHNWLGRSNKAGKVENPLFGGFDPATPQDTNSVHDVFRPTFTYGEAFNAQYARFIDNLYYLKASGLVAAVYTQLTDMKKEENGWLTFDREVSKVDPEKTAAAHRKLFGPAPQPEILYPARLSWSYSVLPMPAKEKGVEDALILQRGVDADKLDWKETKAPFAYGTDRNCTPEWDAAKRLVVKRDFRLDEIPGRMSIRIYSQDSKNRDKAWVYSRIYINGKFVLDETTRHEQTDMKMSEILFNDAAMNALKKGNNTIMIEVVPGVNRGDMKKGPASLLVDFEIVGWN